MSLYSRMLGIVGSVFGIGGPSGPTLTASGGRITASGNVAGSDPMNPTDFITLEYGQANFAAYVQQVYSTPFTVPTNTQVVFVTDIQMTSGDLTVNGILQGIH
jgi:hypothetical protein